uniref:Integrase catalytic domain-containing protein n=1 Tax=Cajanus cajan TaxID=3821 RepID=A0A151SHT6_CAJCA|nr:hypothetical protein KK1_000547 [Cajanus cajan]
MRSSMTKALLPKSQDNSMNRISKGAGHHKSQLLERLPNCHFNEFLERLQVKHQMTSVEHPQTNGQAKAGNKVILKELKRRHGQAKGSWSNQLLEILWAYHCTPQGSTKETPY